MKRKLLATAFAVAMPFILLAQEVDIKDSTQKTPVFLGEVIVYANKFPELFKHVAQYVKVIKDQSALNFQANTGDILINTGSLFVQKSQQGGSSPVIRGFEASRVLLMVDGVRMNNAIYRSGHLQNVITVDNMILDRLEVLYGPSSTLYGSDALGGVVNMYTKNPVLSTINKTNVSGNAVVRYATATEEARAHVDFNIGGEKWASLTSVTYGSFGDITQGARRQSSYQTFGLKNFIVQRYGSTDSAFANPNPNKQSPSDYKQVDVTQKFLFQPKENIQHILNIQYSNSSDVQRYDRLTEVAANAPVFAEWYYGPQLRNMIAYNFSANKLAGFFREIKLTANYQDIEESRITRRFKNNNKDYRWERVNIFGFNADAKHYNGKNELHVGVETNTNYVRSTAERVNIVTGTISRIATRYSDGPTKMSYNAAYAQHTLKINDRWTLNDGLRLSFVKLDARFADTTLMHFPFNKAIQNNVAVTGNLGLVYATPKNFRLAFILSSGFRSPNVDDLTKVFDTRTGYVVVPNTDLKPEYTYNAEINFNLYGEKFSFGGSVFYTWLKNAIVVDKFQLNGQDSIIYQNIKSGVFAPQNKAKAYIAGFSLNAAFTIAKNTSLDAVFTYTKGKYTNAGVTVPLDHVPPTYGRVALKHDNKIWLAEFYTLFNGWKRIADYNPNGEDNGQYATIDGMPSWFTLNIRGAVKVGKNLSAQVLVENLLDRNYRYFASGISAPGRNFVISLKTSF
jgi:hemoglobin/transferrin/lactoferrin receptor protein